MANIDESPKKSLKEFESLYTQLSTCAEAILPYLPLGPKYLFVISMNKIEQLVRKSRNLVDNQDSTTLETDNTQGEPNV